MRTDAADAARPQHRTGQLTLPLLDEIRVGPDAVTPTGSTAALSHAVSQMKLGTSIEVPSIESNWRARDDSNVRPLPSEGYRLARNPIVEQWEIQIINWLGDR